MRGMSGRAVARVWALRGFLRGARGLAGFACRLAVAAVSLAAVGPVATPPALADPGIVAAWGFNQNSRLGDGTTTNRSTPVRIGAGQLQVATPLQVAAGTSHGCVLDAVPNVYCWGFNAVGQLGDRTNTTSSGPTDIFFSAIHLSANFNTTCGVGTDRQAYCWGSNISGQIGDGTSTNRSEPTAVNTGGVLAGKKVTMVAVGSGHACALTSDSVIACWGSNSSGQIGDGTTTSRFTPVAVSTSGALAGKTVTQIAAGRVHTCALTSDGAAFCWGNNSSGQLGDGTTTNRTTPTAVSTGGALAGKTLVQIASWRDHTCAVASDGSAFCWGLNTNGQLGDGTTTQRTSPTAIDSSGALSGKVVTQIATGQNNSCALTSQGLVYCWGLNSSGQIGDGTTTQRASPTAVDASGALAGQFVSSIAMGQDFVAVAAAPCGPGAPIATGTGANARWAGLALPCNNYLNADASLNKVLGQSSSNNLINSQYNVENAAAGTGWAVYRHDATTNAYVLMSLTDTLQRGTGYWIKSYQSPKLNKLIVPGQNVTTTPITAPVTQAQGCASANGCFAIPVTAVAGVARYNFLGNPFPWDVDWSQVRVRVDGSASTLTPSAAETAGYMAKQFAHWNGTAYDVYSDVAPNIGNLPYMGSFWVQALPGGAGHTLELLVPKLATNVP